MGEKVKVLLINSVCKRGSTGKIAYDLYNAVNESGNQATVCYGRGKKISETNVFKFGIDIETYIHALLTRITGFTGCFSPISTYRLIRFIKKFKPDVVHIHELHAYFVNIKPLLNFLKKNKIKTIFTLHCEFDYTGKCGHSVECENWKTECGNCPHLKDYPTSLLFDRTKYMYRQKKALFENFENMTVTAPSKWLGDRAKQSFLKEKEIRVINNGIDTEVFKPCDSAELRVKHQIEQDEKVVLALAPGLMSRQKGGEYVLELARRLQDEKIRFILIGADNEITNKPRNVIDLGKIYDRGVLAQYYSLADVFVICSERENFPTTCIEAQSCGTQVCGFDTGGTKETDVTDSGYFTDYGNIESLKEIVLKILNAGESVSREEISKAAKTKFSLDEMCKQYFELYGITEKER